jgi:hypothetical protein
VVARKLSKLAVHIFKFLAWRQIPCVAPIIFRTSGPALALLQKEHLCCLRYTLLAAFGWPISQVQFVTEVEAWFLYLVATKRANEYSRADARGFLRTFGARNAIELS